jgi:2-polyprenyl-3-methyl-5-hydroxy-6-metoxy-1,4-benzoquinol methylase
MRTLDRFLQRWRIMKALPQVRTGDRLLDVGCFDGVLLSRAAGRVSEAIGIDPLAEPVQRGNIRILRGCIPGGRLFEPARFDCITLLAVLEHVPEPEKLARECFDLLAPGGRVIITVPRPAVDYVLAALRAIRLVDGMSLEEHHGYDVAKTPEIFGQAGFQLLAHRSFQLGLNCLFVFEKPSNGLVGSTHRKSEKSEGHSLETSRSEL